MLPPQGLHQLHKCAYGRHSLPPLASPDLFLQLKVLPRRNCCLTFPSRVSLPLKHSLMSSWWKEIIHNGNADIYHTPPYNLLSGNQVMVCELLFKI